MNPLTHSMQARVLYALQACLRPLARLLLTCGIGYREFARIAKLAFVREAMERQTADGSALNISRISVSTGLSRKELARIRDEIDKANVGDESSIFSGHQACGGRVLQLWHVDPKYLDEIGNPSALPMEGAAVSFTSLVRRVAGDIPIGAVKSELVAAGAVEELSDGRLAARKRHFIPGDAGEEILVGLTKFVYPVLVGLERNTQAKHLYPFLQRVSYSHHLGTDGAQMFRKVARTRAIEFIDAIDDWVSAAEEPPETLVAEAETGMSAVGVFFFEGRVPDARSLRDVLDERKGGGPK